MSKIRVLVYLLLLMLFSTPFFGARNVYRTEPALLILPPDTAASARQQMKPYDITAPVIRSAFGDSIAINRDSLRLNEQLALQSDSLVADSLHNDSILKKKSPLDNIVDYLANDSIILTGTNWGHLYGDSEVNYGEIKLKAEKININMDSSEVDAAFGLDSIGQEFGFPVFTNSGTDYESKKMRYNFKSKKGISNGIVTQQGEGYVTAGIAKKTEDDAFYMREGRYTTCDHHDHPHFYLCLTKAKVQPGKNVVTGPAYLVIEDLPIPFIGLPFGFFPFSDSYSSGVIMPSYGDELERGFNLRDGGYYFAFNDNMDLALTGDIYTKGSWALRAKSTYRKRYKYSGNFNAEYMLTKLGDKGIDQTVSKDIRLSWTHSQDAKANMYRTLSANVNFSTSSYNRNNLDVIGGYNTVGNNAYTSNTKASSVNISQRFPNSPWTINATMNLNQRTQDSTISVTLPDLTISMSRIAPFKRKERVGAEKWYEKIQLSYSGEFRNSLDTKEDRFFKSGLRDWRNGMKHSVPVSATFSLGSINITPSANYNEQWHTRKILKDWNSRVNRFVPTDTLNGFYRTYDFNFSVSMQTKLYGMFKPLFLKDKIQAIRHVFTPSVSFSYNPDFTDPRFGSHYRRIVYNDLGEAEEKFYSPFENEEFRPSSSRKSGSINFSFDNNIEMKVRSEKDSTGWKKISLVDLLGINFSYNMVADSLKWSDINTTLRLKLSKSLTVNLNATFDPYMYKVTRWDESDNTKPVQITKVDRLRISNGSGLGRLIRTGFSISPSINQDTFKKWFGKGGDAAPDKTQNNSTDPNAPPGETTEEKPKSLLAKRKEDDGTRDSDGYIKNDVKWNLGFSYSVNYGPTGEIGPVENGYADYKRKLTHNFSLNGQIQPTKNWNFTFMTAYDFDLNKLSYMNCSLTRDLHCWSISATFTPIGPTKVYYVTLRASSQMLQDLKYDRRGRSSSYDPAWQ